MSIKSPTKSHQQIVAEWKEDPEFVAVYDELETETAELRKGLQSHQKSGLIPFSGNRHYTMSKSTWTEVKHTIPGTIVQQRRANYGNCS
ncbi:MAG: hypothetical protein JJE30_13835 [Desulfuromonadales bacterium]|nr:hypothetical protein [Desulfuromonadales bacterium]